MSYRLAKALTVLGILGGGYFIYRYFKGRKTESQQEDEIVNQTGGGTGGSGTGGGGAPNPTNQTYANAMYQIFAEQIWDAAHANNFTGTQEDEIYDVFKQMKTDTDISKLIGAFGKKRMYLTFSDAPLKEWLQAEMNSSEIAKINSILQSNKITYRF